MHFRRNARRGNCLVTSLIAVGVVGLLVLIGSVIVLATQGPAASAGFKPWAELGSKGEFLKAPGKVDTELSKGALLIVMPVSSDWIGKRTPVSPTVTSPSTDITYTVTVTDSEGKSIEIEPNDTPRQADEPFYLVAGAQIPADGKYTVEIKASDDKTPAPMVLVSMARSDFDSLASAVLPILWSFLGCCGACCGGVIGLIGLIGALIAKKFAPPRADPLAM